MYTRKAYATREAPKGAVRDDQPDAREGQAGRLGDTERFVIPLKPGNAGGGKGPQFKTDATSSEGFGDWATYQLRKLFRNCRLRCTRKRRQKPAIASTRCTTRSAARIFWPMPMPSVAPTRAPKSHLLNQSGIELFEVLDSKLATSTHSWLTVCGEPTSTFGVASYTQSCIR
jgi:hypothetical protein